MAIGTPTGTITAANTSSTTAVTASINTGSESGRTLFAVGGSTRDGSNPTHTCTFGATSMTSEITRVDSNVGIRFRTSIFRLGSVTGAAAVTLTASSATDGIGVGTFYIDGVADAAAEATANEEDFTNPMDITITGTTAGAFALYAVTSEAEANPHTMAATGMTEIIELDYDAGFNDLLNVGWEEATGTSDTGSWGSGESMFSGTHVAASFAAAAGGGGATIPIFWHHYRNMKAVA